MLTNFAYHIQLKNRKTYCIQRPVGFSATFILLKDRKVTAY